jgi:hypothetical protein
MGRDDCFLARHISDKEIDVSTTSDYEELLLESYWQQNIYVYVYVYLVSGSHIVATQPDVPIQSNPAHPIC